MKCLIAILLTLSSLNIWAQSEEKLKELTRRIEELENQQQELFLQVQPEGNQVNSFLKDNLAFGGFFEAGINVIDGEDTKFQMLNTSNLLGINLAAEYNGRLRFVAQTLTGLTFPLVNPHNNPAATPDERQHNTLVFGSIVSQGYLEYLISNNMRIQAGLGYVPFGYASQQRELVLFIRRGGPQIIRTNNQIIAPLWNGIHLSGDYSIDGSDYGYNLYTTSPIDPSTNQTLGVGGRLWWSSMNNNVTAGVSAQAGKYKSATDEVIGTDLQIRNEKFLLTTEYAQHVTSGEDPWSIYLEPGVMFFDDQWLFYVFGDYAQNPLNTIGATKIPDDYSKWEYGTGVNWLPTSFTRLRMGFTYHDYVRSNARISGQERDYYSFDLSVGVAF